MLRVVPMPADGNHRGDIFGGWIMSQVDIAGGVLASQHAARPRGHGGGAAQQTEIEFLILPNRYGRLQSARTQSRVFPGPPYDIMAFGKLQIDLHGRQAPPQDLDRR